MVTKVFKVIIAGSRDYNDYGFIKEKMDFLLRDKIRQGYKIIIISGTARGADSCGEKYAQERGYKVLRFYPDWDNLGKAAGMVRNAEMAEEADACVIFFNNISVGSEGMRKICEKKKIPYKAYKDNKILHYLL